jgi:hypothetical protein
MTGWSGCRVEKLSVKLFPGFDQMADVCTMVGDTIATSEKALALGGKVRNAASRKMSAA